MKRTYLLALLLFLHISYLANGQCSISAPATACEGEVVELKASHTQTIDSVLWDFGDQASGKQTKLNHVYTSSGTFTIKLKVYSGGDSCETTKNITIYAGPEINVSIDPSSSYCFSSNQICLNDSTKRGKSNGKVTKRTILWGDGNRSLATNPSLPQKVCHTYRRNGTFSITVQEENEFGCISEKILSVTIKKDFPINFQNEYIGESCVDETHLFLNDSAQINADVDSFVWSWGDGTFERTKFDSIYHTYRAKGTYLVELKVYSKNGCVNIKSINVVIDFPEIRFVTSVSDDTICNKQNTIFEASKDYGTEWEWTALNTEANLNIQFDGRLTYFTPTTPGTYYLSLRIQHGRCRQTKAIDTIEVVGVQPHFLLLNGAQCGNNDTVYACNQSIVHGTKDITYFWDFGDSAASQCTTNLATGAFLDSNCNFVIGEHASHFYSDTICTQVKLMAFDNENGCLDSTFEAATLLLTGKDQFGFIAKRKCIGSSSDNTIQFLRQECLRGIRVNYDSACDKDRFLPFIDFYNYTRTCDSNGRVTVGFAVHNGDGRIYGSCDTSDYIISNRNTCIDTLWFHHWFTLQKQPDPSFYVDTAQRCAPNDIKFHLYEPEQENVVSMEWSWGDGTDEEFKPPTNYDTLPDGVHFFDGEKRYPIKLSMETDSGCTKTYNFDLDLGYFNDFYFPEDTCINDSILLYDTLKYWGQSHNYWKDTTYDKVGISWDFDDGRGFATKGPEPVISYPQPGVYTVRMASFDEFGCVDTVEHDITITCVEAGIREIQDKLLCGGIVRFRDSSSMKLNLGRITSHFWDFGDGGTPSYLENPFHYYRKFGTFTVTHIVESENGCTDTAYYEMNVEGPESNFDIVSDSIGCAPLTVEFDNKSDNASRYIWEFGDSANLRWTTFSDTNVTHTYDKPGVYFVRLLALDSIFDDQQGEYIYCESYYPDSINDPGIFKKVVVLENPKVDFAVPDVICKGQSIVLEDRSDTAYKQYIWSISAGDKINTTDKTASYTFPDTGTFTIHYTPTYTVDPPLLACPDSMTKTVKVSGVEAIFDHEQIGNCPVFQLTNRSEFADSIQWDLGNPDSSWNYPTEAQITHDFVTNDAEFRVCLMAWNRDGCRDTACEILSSESVFDLFIPNVFTPNGDNWNNEYDIEIEGEKTYELLIYNRWGSLVYESHEDSEFGDGKNWDGINPKTGENYPAGVYFFIFKYELECGDESGETQGTITLLR